MKIKIGLLLICVVTSVYGMDKVVELKSQQRERRSSAPVFIPETIHVVLVTNGSQSSSAHIPVAVGSVQFWSLIAKCNYARGKLYEALAQSKQ